MPEKKMGLEGRCYMFRDFFDGTITIRVINEILNSLLLINFLYLTYIVTNENFLFLFWQDRDDDNEIVRAYGISNLPNNSATSMIEEEDSHSSMSLELSLSSYISLDLTLG